ncbi:hypothetical protein HYQ46_002744 [Verticillium longisporum]|nr:hypothetical protein HYQ46_002744 [Verticillium longisporum]
MEMKIAQDLAVFLSVPQSFVGTETGNATRVCGYTMPGQNATSVGDASSEDSCSGVLSEERIEEALKTPMPPSDGSCPELDLGDKCDVSTGFRTSNPVQLNPSVCVLDNLPHTDVPNGYRSFAGFPGWRIMPPDEEENEFDVYDLRVQQTVPMLFTVQSGSQEKVYLVCLAPNKVVDGSREPQAEFPPSDAGVVWRGSGLAFAVTFMAAAMQFETGNATRVCGYTMPGQNATSAGDASSEDSCSGVLSEECIEEALKTPMPPFDGSCPELDLGDKCDVSTGFRTSNPVQLNPSVCVLDNLPHTDVPNGYRSFAGFPGWRIMPADEDENEFDVYDLRVQQTVPMLFTVQSGSQEKVYLVCIAPNKVVEGSREPHPEFPPSDAGVVWGGSGLAFAAAVMAAAMQLVP